MDTYINNYMDRLVGLLAICILLLIVAIFTMFPELIGVICDAIHDLYVKFRKK